jgi:hypothetical protein
MRHFKHSCISITNIVIEALLVDQRDKLEEQVADQYSIATDLY